MKAGLECRFRVGGASPLRDAECLASMLDDDDDVDEDEDDAECQAAMLQVQAKMDDIHKIDARNKKRGVEREKRRQAKLRKQRFLSQPQP